MSLAVSCGTPPGAVGAVTWRTYEDVDERDPPPQWPTWQASAYWPFDPRLSRDLCSRGYGSRREPTEARNNQPRRPCLNRARGVGQLTSCKWGASGSRRKHTRVIEGWWVEGSGGVQEDVLDSPAVMEGRFLVSPMEKSQNKGLRKA